MCPALSCVPNVTVKNITNFSFATQKRPGQKPGLFYLSLSEYEMKITKSQLREMIREAINEQVGGNDILQQDLGGEGKELLDTFIQSMDEAVQAWYALHYWLEPSEEADVAMLQELGKEVGNFIVDENLTAWLNSLAEKAKADK